MKPEIESECYDRVFAVVGRLKKKDKSEIVQMKNTNVLF